MARLGFGTAAIAGLYRPCTEDDAMATMDAAWAAPATDWASWTAADLRPYVEDAVQAFGAQRLMFGSDDWPVCALTGTYADVLEVTGGLSAAQRDAVFGATATRVYGLTPTPE
jgi:predicted TIM-barrel fold metal-dependent hydrolase